MSERAICDAINIVCGAVIVLAVIYFNQKEQ